MNSFKKVALITSAVSALSFANAATAMDQEMTMLEKAVENSLDRLGIDDVNISNLTLSELSQIRVIAGGDESTNRKSALIEAIIGPKDYEGPEFDLLGFEGTNTLRASLQAEAQSVGVDKSLASLNNAELTAVKSVVNSDESSTEKSRAIETIIADSRGALTIADTRALEASIQRRLAALDVDVNMKMLTVSQLAEIRAVLGSDLSTNDQERRIGAIIAN